MARYVATLDELTDALYDVSPVFRALVNENTPPEDRPDFDVTSLPVEASLTEAQAAAVLYNTNAEFRAFVDAKDVKADPSADVAADPFAVVEPA